MHKVPDAPFVPVRYWQGRKNLSIEANRDSIEIVEIRVYREFKEHPPCMLELSH